MSCQILHELDVDVTNEPTINCLEAGIGSVSFVIHAFG
jgi:hypothetical protein